MEAGPSTRGISKKVGLKIGLEFRSGVIDLELCTKTIY
jgi:hypothetical protein